MRRVRRRSALAPLVLALVALLVAGCLATGDPTPVPSAVATPSAVPTPSPAPTPTGSPYWVRRWPSAEYEQPSPTPRRRTAASRPTRVAVPALGIDLPVVVADLASTWPLCDVAEYLRPPAFEHPGLGGVTYVYAHAQEGMFLPILAASRRSNGRAMIGTRVFVWTANDERFEYRVTQVRRRQKSLDWAFRLPPDYLVLQTSENQYRTGTKVMLVAAPTGSATPVARAEARPIAQPRRCGR